MGTMSFDVAHMLAGGMLVLSFVLLYQDRLYALLNVYALHAFVLALSVAPSLVGWFTKPWPPPWFEGMGVETGAPTNDERPEGR